MRLRTLLFAVAFCGMAATGSQAADPRISTRFYNPDEVVVVHGRAGVQATIAFADQEMIENVAIGDSTSWQVTPNKRANLLFVKPLGASARTNMTVVTDRRTYLFDLTASPMAAPLYVLRFTYPAEPPGANKVAGGLTPAEVLAATAIPKDVPPGQAASLNFAWRTTGARKILPSRVYNDNDATYLSWPVGSAIPAILTRNAKGEEGAVNYAVRGDVLILDSVPDLIILRAGRELATLENQAQPKTALAMGPSIDGPSTATAALPTEAQKSAQQGR
ncbi:TrbG/VirB9 family P-type conjugative transfer protein [Phenylobacterium immobile]|uniref:TrbG/VirB9 family P-type conjugative transfer protein n=1 Tax=Phenylobacterium immobile TaxID=21 RepID=UPI000B2310DF|nr:TrbG/VirB9 family P-type conjugative transfer protein [Phenylobacterium immobile]